MESVIDHYLCGNFDKEALRFDHPILRIKGWSINPVKDDPINIDILEHITCPPLLPGYWAPLIPNSLGKQAEHFIRSILLIELEDLTCVCVTPIYFPNHWLNSSES